ncbi:MAG TPA: ATP-grasp fold amidoligase family protein [Bacillota bacterium]|nr:ATP-grasp fold amidoligase family protein [Bacillota bacterium]
MASIREITRHCLRKSDYLFFIVKYWRLRFLMAFTKCISDEVYIRRQYKSRTGKTLDLSKPELYNEKVQYAKLYYRDVRLKQLVDKYEVRKYVEEKIGGKYLTKLYGVYNSVNEIPFDELPDRFVMKLTNGSRFNYICKHKTQTEIRKIKRRFKKWVKLDYYILGREWAYKDVKNRIICEEYLETEDPLGLNDYKVFCFNGEPKLIQVNFARFTNHKLNFYTPEWDFVDERVAYPNDPDAPIEKPKNLDEMLECAHKLSEGFPHVRVDFYNIGNRLVFGEMTFYHGAGYLHFENQEFEKKLGSYWEIKQ